ncbi:MAG: hypothetical protein KatS3mg016_1982 [Fimbriimonadales bacterium]|nr:MAG: hypothetical protein KatS3mg016_1982 [Fimbriimonadales bacterium]
MWVMKMRTVERLRMAEPETLETLIEQLELTNPAEATALLDFVKNSGSSILKSTALQRVAEQGIASGCWNKIVEFLEDPDPTVRVDAIEALEDARNPNVLLRLTVSALADHSWLVRGWATAALGESGEAALKPLLWKIVRTDRSAFVRLNGWYALVWLGDEEAYNQMLRFLKHPYYRLRIAACNLILRLYDSGRLDPQKITETLDIIGRLIEDENIISVNDVMNKCLCALRIQSEIV